MTYLLLPSGPNGPAPPQTSPKLGVRTVVSQDNSGVGTNPMTSSGLSTTSGSMLVVLRAGVTLDDSAPTDNYGNTYTKIGNSIPYAGQSQYQMSVYLATNINGGTGHVLSFAKPNSPTAESSAIIVEIKGASSYQITNNYPTASPGTTNSLTTTHNCRTLSFWSGDGDQTNVTMTCTPNAGNTVIGSMLTIPTAGAVQVACCTNSAQNLGPGTYAVTWTWSPTQGAGCYMMSFEP